MDTVGLRRIVSKLTMLNSARLEELRESCRPMPDETAEYHERIKEKDWLEKVRQELVLQEPHDSNDRLSQEIKLNMPARYAMIIENIRKSGAGFLHDESFLEDVRNAARFGPTNPPPCPARRNKMTTEDKAAYQDTHAEFWEVQDKDNEFLESCCVKGDIETW